KPLAIKSRDGDLSDEEDARFDELVNNINECREGLTNAEARAKKGDEVLGSLEDLNRGRGSAARSVPSGRTENRDTNPDRIDFRNPGRRFVRTDSFKHYAASPNGTSARELLGSTFFSHNDVDVNYREGDGPSEFRDLVHTGAFGSDYMQPNRLPGVVSGTPFPLRVRDVLTNGRTDSATVEFVRKLDSTNNAKEVAEATTVTGATEKPESAIDLEVVSTTVKTI